jgi:hypothetical protein
MEARRDVNQSSHYTSEKHRLAVLYNAFDPSDIVEMARELGFSAPHGQRRCAAAGTSRLQPR